MTREYAVTCLAGFLLAPQIVMHVEAGCQGWSMGSQRSPDFPVLTAQSHGRGETSSSPQLVVISETSGLHSTQNLPSRARAAIPTHPLDISATGVAEFFPQ
jgi:hypothetical protein